MVRSPRQASETFTSNTYHSLLFFPGMTLHTPEEPSPAA